VQVNIRADIQTMTSELEAGASDLIVLPSWIDFVRLKSDSKYQAIVHPSNTRFYLVGSSINPPLDNKKVRQALWYTLDHQRLVDVSMFGVGQPQSLWWTPTS